MGDSGSDACFERLLERSHVLESLDETLRQMLEGSYISKSTAEAIMREAAKSDDVWTFSVDSPVICLGSGSKESGLVSHGYSRGYRTFGLNSLPLATIVDTLYHPGCVQIKAVVDPAESK
ncbi:uncharacterized protein BcabD6B2_07310 [Babesia caballi]|uniref:Uncharacterized protein n=1 Tax=Babesia caballi TaxID=5871 RepID=A0AAV4LN95_BABCB|nr:hypothetical protein BcabD6B2_07310 [Babesia caballi]